MPNSSRFIWNWSKRSAAVRPSASVVATFRLPQSGQKMTQVSGPRSPQSSHFQLMMCLLGRVHLPGYKLG